MLIEKYLAILDPLGAQAAERVEARWHPDRETRGKAPAQGRIPARRFNRARGRSVTVTGLAGAPVVWCPVTGGRTSKRDSTRHPNRQQSADTKGSIPRYRN